jgi:hypothetical protein
MEEAQCFLSIKKWYDKNKNKGQQVQMHHLLKFREFEVTIGMNWRSMAVCVLSRYVVERTWLYIEIIYSHTCIFHSESSQFF